MVFIIYSCNMNRLRRFICRHFHRAASWPRADGYTCMERDCGLRWPLPFVQDYYESEHYQQQRWPEVSGIERVHAETEAKEGK